MDIRFTNRWGGFDYWELYRILDGLIILTYKPGYEDQATTELIHEINQEMIRRQKESDIRELGGKSGGEEETRESLL